MNVWFEKNTELGRPCTHCKEQIELDQLTMMVSRAQKARRKAFPFHPKCFPEFVEKIYGVGDSIKYKGDPAMRRRYSEKLRYLAKAYYGLVDKKQQKIMSDYDKIRLYTYRIKSRILYHELMECGGPLANKGADSILFTHKPLWLDKDEEYVEWEGVDVKAIYNRIMVEDI